MSLDPESQRFVDAATAEEEQHEGYAGTSRSPKSPKRTFPEAEVDENKEPKQKKQKRQQYSSVWDDFTVITKTDSSGKSEERAQCNHCKKEYAMNSHKNGTSAYKRHIPKCKIKARDGDVRNMLVTAEGKLQAKKIEQPVFREMVAMTIIQHDLPYSYVEYERVRSTWKYLNADVKFFTRNTAAADVFKFYEKQTAMLKIELAEIPGRICFTSDLWSAIKHEGYMCLTAHYIDKEWKLKNKILAFCAFPPPHTGVDLAEKLVETWKEWGIEKKVFSITLDNATSNDSMQTIVKSQLVMQNDLLCRGEFFHVRCSAHILNLIVQEGLKVVGESLHKIRESVKFAQSSDSRIKLFERCVESVGIKLKAGLLLDVPTRWNSTYKMLDRAVKYRAAFESLSTVERSYKHLPTEIEWVRGKKMCDFLKPFDEITRLMSGSTYPTSNLYFMQVFKIQMWLTEHETSTDVILFEMVKAMKVKFHKYWEEYSDILAMATVFDPRFKLTLAEYCFKKLDKDTSQAKLKHVRSKLNTLFKAYKDRSKSIPTSEMHETVSGGNLEEEIEDEGNFANYEDFLAFRTSNVNASGKTMLETYLAEPALSVQDFGTMDILNYWKDNSHRFGELASMACDLLSIPITTVASESSFSIGARVLNKYRSCLLAKNVQALICTRSWLRGFEPYDESDEEFDNDALHSSPSPSTLDV